MKCDFVRLLFGPFPGEGLPLVWLVESKREPKCEPNREPKRGTKRSTKTECDLQSVSYWLGGRPHHSAALHAHRPDRAQAGGENGRTDRDSLCCSKVRIQKVCQKSSEAGFFDDVFGTILKVFLTRMHLQVLCSSRSSNCCPPRSRCPRTTAN